MTVATSTKLFTSPTYGEVELTVEERGSGRPFLILHGGAGPLPFARFDALLADAEQARVILPTHPGFLGTPRPGTLTTAAGLAALYSDLLDELDVQDVTVLGNSFGGWIASELALLHSPRISRIVIVNGAGIEVEGHPIASLAGLAPNEIMKLSFHNPEPFRIDPSTLTDPQKAALGANQAALATYSGATGFDPTLRERLAGVKTPTLVLWGESDRIVDVDYGRAWAAAIPGARFETLPGTGHMPHAETPELLLRALLDQEDTTGWQTELTVDTAAAPAAVWEALRALQTGTVPLASGDRRQLNGPFAVHSTISVTPVGLDTLSSTITEIADRRVLAEQTDFNGLVLHLRHTLQPLENGGTRITRRLEITGEKADVQGPVAGPRISEDYPEALDEIVALASKTKG